MKRGIFLPMSWLLFVLYTLLFCWLITRIFFFSKSGLSPSLLISLFLLKVAAAVVYGLVMGHSAYYRSIADTWRYQADSIAETKLLFEHPGQWLTNLFAYPYVEGYAKLFSTDNSYWNDIKFNFLVKLLSIFNLFSFNHYYVNAVLFSFLTFFGWACLIRTYHAIFPGRVNAIAGAWIFIPTFVFWCSGIHKDGLAFTGLAIFFYHTYFAIEKDGFSLKRMAGILLGLFIVLPQSNYLILAILPLTLAWWLSKKFPGKTAICFGGVVALCMIFFFLSGSISQRIDLPRALANKQNQFLALDARSKLPYDTLRSDIGSYVKQLPAALNHVLLRPYIWESTSLLYLLPALELLAIYGLVILRFLYGPPPGISRAVVFGFMLACIMILILGYTVPILGAIVRYRAFYLPLFVIPICASIPWQRIPAFQKIKLLKK